MATPVDMGPRHRSYDEDALARHSRFCPTCRQPHGWRQCEERALIAREAERFKTPALGVETMEQVVDGRLR